MIDPPTEPTSEAEASADPSSDEQPDGGFAVVDAFAPVAPDGDDGFADGTAGPPIGPQGMIPGRRRRPLAVERVAMRILATGGIIGVAVALGAVLGANHVSGWIIGLAVGLTSLALAALLWSSREV